MAPTGPVGGARPGPGRAAMRRPGNRLARDASGRPGIRNLRPGLRSRLARGATGIPGTGRSARGAREDAVGRASREPAAGRIPPGNGRIQGRLGRARRKP